MSEQRDEHLETLKEIAKWVRFAGFGQVKTVLTTTLNDSKKVLAYHLSDGKNTSIMISKQTGINQPRVTELWKEWLTLGLGESVSASGGSRFKKSFDLKMFGFTIPEIKVAADVEQKTAAPEPTEGGKNEQ